MPKKDNDFFDPDDSFQFDSRLNEAMELTGDTVSTLVDKTGIPNSTIRSYLKGESVPGVLQLRKIAKGMGIKAGWFFGDEESGVPLQNAIPDIEKDLDLLNDLFRYMTPVQRSRVLKRVLASISRHLDNVTDEADPQA